MESKSNSAGVHTSEFSLAVLWSVMSAGLLVGLLSLAPCGWPIMAAALPAVCLVVWMAGLQAHNYSENRFQLKARQMMVPPPDAKEPARAFGFGRHVAADGESDEEEVEDDA